MKSPFLPYQALDLENLNSSPRAEQRSSIVARLAVPGGLSRPYAILPQNISHPGI
jgi:hypothetical protein